MENNWVLSQREYNSLSQKNKNLYKFKSAVSNGFSQPSIWYFKTKKDQIRFDKEQKEIGINVGVQW